MSIPDERYIQRLREALAAAEKERDEYHQTAVQVTSRLQEVAQERDALAAALDMATHEFQPRIYNPQACDADRITRTCLRRPDHQVHQTPAVILARLRGLAGPSAAARETDSDQ